MLVHVLVYCIFSVCEELNMECKIECEIKDNCGLHLIINSSEILSRVL